MGEQTIRIAVVRSLDGSVTVCGPEDFGDEYSDAMQAAICFHIEAGHEPADKAWLIAKLPSVTAVIPEFVAMMEDDA